ncbi:MAG: DMT family transporter [Acidobacteria bacterium]|nr:MAG: DMT family transporter [Acidobacteriota bacterium]
MNRPRTQAGAAGLLVVVQVLFGVHYFAAKIVLAEIPPLAWAGLRVAAAALFLLPLAFLISGRRAVPRPADLARLAGLSLLGVVINQWAFVEGLSRTSITHSALINTGIPVLTLIFAVLMRQERANPGKLASILLAMLGVLVLLRVDSMVLDRATRGDLITLINATSFSLFLVLSRPLLTRLDPLMATGFLFAFGSLVLLPLGAPLWLQISPSTLQPATWLWGAFVVLGATVVAYSLNYLALRRMESSVVALFILLQPLLAGSADVWVMGSKWTLRLSAATVLIGAGVVCALLAGRRRAVTPLPRGG